MVNLSVSENYITMSQHVGEQIISYINDKPRSLICFAAGDSPKGVFEYLVKAKQEGRVKFDECQFISLDEWVGLGPDVVGSCIQTMNEHLFLPLSINDRSIHFFNGKAPNLIEECKRIDKVIFDHSGIDLMLLGIGQNGHLGFNEPNVSFDLYSHVVGLDSVTQTVGKKYFKETIVPKQGITLGIRHIMDAEKVILIANGQKKSKIIYDAFFKNVTNKVPASILQYHPGFSLCIEKEAASNIQIK